MDKESEKQRDIGLGIATCGLQKTGDSYHFRRYEPTPYNILDGIFDHVPLKQSDCFVDFGCGMGRTVFYTCDRFSCNAVGVEYQQNLYVDALLNCQTFKGKSKLLKFEHIMAQDFLISKEQNYFYFFNPFSPEIFERVCMKIERVAKVYDTEKTVMLYYPPDEYFEVLEKANFKKQLQKSLPAGLGIPSREQLYIYNLK